MYFEKPGPENTGKCLEAAKKAFLERGIKSVVIASTWGNTAEKALEIFGDIDVNLVFVSHNWGFKIPGVQEFSEKTRKKTEDAGARVISGTMPTRTLGRAIKDKLGFSQEDIACAAWRMFGQGTKVCVEIAAMACDAGAVECGDIIAVAGTGNGADTAVIISAESSNRTFDMKIREILAKPSDW